MKTNVLCEREGQTVLSNLFEELSVLLQDSDDKEEKDRVQDSLKRMNDTATYMLLGEEGVGKTSLLHMIFQEILPEQDDMASDLCEYRWGETDYESPVTEGIQKKFISSDNMRGISIIDTKGIKRFGKNTLEKIQVMTEACSAIFVVFDVSNVKSTRLWDIIETFPKKKMIFFLTKCDTVSAETLKENITKVKAYMQESNIDAPVFPVSITKDCMSKDISSLESVRSYIREQVIGENPLLKRQEESIKEMQMMLTQFQESFQLRKKQYESDARILQKINASLDKYVSNHREIVMDFNKKLEALISKDIDDYEQEIISKMDPYKIKERFKTKEDFMDYLNIVNDNYRSMMNDSVNRKTIEIMKSCMRDLEIVFQEASGYFNERESILALNDRFYGSLSQSRKHITTETRETAIMAGKFYTTLSDASIELFLQVWNERKKYDYKIALREIFSIVSTGGGTAAVLGCNGYKGAKLAKLLFDTTKTGLGMITPQFWIILIIDFLSVKFIDYIAKKIFDPMAADKMEKNVHECIEQFKKEVDRTRRVMIEQVTGQVADLFEKELADIDSCFTDFRISVNVESEKLPLLEEKTKLVDELMEQIKEMEGEQKIR